MYSRKLGKLTLTFGHEGVLYMNSFIMYDKQTDTKWVHVTAMAVKGKLKGQKLTTLPSTLTTWKEWKKTHPKTKVLTGRRRGGMMGTYSGQDLKGFGYVVEDGKAATLYPFETLDVRKVIMDKVGKTAVVVVFSKETAAAIAWESGKYKFSAAEDGQMTDKKTKSTWNILTGKCEKGKLKGKSLKQRYGVSILTSRYKSFWPKGRTYK